MENADDSRKRKIIDFWPVKIVVSILTRILILVVTQFVYMLVFTSVLNGQNSLLIFHKTGKTRIVSYKKNYQRNKDLLTYESASEYCNRVWNEIIYRVHGKIRDSSCIEYESCSSEWSWATVTSVVSYSDMTFIRPHVITEILCSVYTEVITPFYAKDDSKTPHSLGQLLDRQSQNADRLEASQYWDLISSLIILVISDYENPEVVIDGNTLQRAVLLAELYSQIDQLNRPKACSGCQIVERTLHRLNKSEEFELDVEYLLASCLPGYRLYVTKK